MGKFFIELIQPLTRGLAFTGIDDYQMIEVAVGLITIAVTIIVIGIPAVVIRPREVRIILVSYC